MLVIIDCNGKEKDALTLKIVTHEVQDAINKGAIPVKFVEAVIKGRNRPSTWKEWYPLVEFQVNNPSIRL